MTTRKYSSKAQQTTLSAPITSTATSMSVVNGAAVMGGKTLTGTQTYTVVIDPDTALEEIVNVTVYSSGNTLTIARGIDSSSPGTGSAHSAGAVVRHMAIGRDYQEANDHIEASAAVHGLAGSVVGTTDTQTLTNKTLTSPVVTSLTLNDSSIVFEGATADAFETTLTVVDPTADRTITLPNVTGTVITTGDTGTVTGTMIASDTIVNADVNSAAAIAYSKLALAGTITSADIANDTIVDADINTAANIAWTKIAPSATVSATELGYVDGVTSSIQTQLDSKLATATASSTYAPLASPALTGTPTAPTATAGTSTTQVATTAFVGTAISNLVAGAPTTLDTLDEIAAAIADTGNFSDTVVLKSGSTMSGALAMGTNKITGLGTPTAPTATAGTSTTQVATTAFVGTAVSNLVASAPSTLDTLNELATALGNDAAFSTTVTNSIAAKLPLAGGTMTGAIAMGTNKVTGLGTPSASTDAATKGYVDTVTVAPSNLTGPITSVGSATTVASQTGTGSTFVMNTSPTLVTPVLGVATATSINGTSIPSTKTLVVTTDKLSTLAATTSAELAGVISDETGSGALVFATSPTLVTPVLGTPTSATLTNATGLPVSGITASTTTALGVGSVELGHATDTTIARVSAGVASIEGVNIVTTSSTDTLTNKTLTTPTISSPKISSTYTAKTAAYTFASGDEGQLFSMNNAATQQFNIPTDATFNFAVGTEINVFWITGAGQPTIGAVTPGTTTVISTGATSATPKLRVANSGATCKKLAANSWIVFGDLA